MDIDGQFGDGVLGVPSTVFEGIWSQGEEGVSVTALVGVDGLTTVEGHIFDVLCDHVSLELEFFSLCGGFEFSLTKLSVDLLHSIDNSILFLEVHSVLTEDTVRFVLSVGHIIKGDGSLGGKTVTKHWHEVTELVAGVLDSLLQLFWYWLVEEVVLEVVSSLVESGNVCSVDNGLLSFWQDWDSAVDDSSSWALVVIIDHSLLVFSIELLLLLDEVADQLFVGGHLFVVGFDLLVVQHLG